MDHLNEYDLTDCSAQGLTEIEVNMPAELTVKNHTKRMICGSRQYLEYLEVEREFPGAMTKPETVLTTFSDLCSGFFPFIDFYQDMFESEYKGKTYNNYGFRILDLSNFKTEYDKMKQHPLIYDNLWICTNNNEWWLQIKGRKGKKK